jgi:hypothetical protein
MAPRTLIEDNVFYGGPRAHININDGLGGGHVVRRNALWGSCRESQDHGPINTLVDASSLAPARSFSSSSPRQCSRPPRDPILAPPAGGRACRT